MSDVPMDRFKPTEATESLYQAIKSRCDRAEHATQLQESPQTIQATPATLATQLEVESEQGSSLDDYFEEFREWCERRRTNWPDSKDDFLSDNECLLIIDIEDSYPSNPCKTKKDYSWVPNALWEIFNSSLKPETKLNILEYFLSLLSVLILSDALNGRPHARIYRDLLLRTVAPSASCLTSGPEFLGSLDPPKAPDLSPSDGSESEEIALVRDLRYLLHLHASNPK
jgi:hypothetical protein